MAYTKPSAPFYTKLAMVLISLIALFYIAQILLTVWNGTFQWGSLADLAIWAYTIFSFGPSSWRHALYSPLGVFGKLKT